jgi:hypothetical protein
MRRFLLFIASILVGLATVSSVLQLAETGVEHLGIALGAWGAILTGVWSLVGLLLSVTINRGGGSPTPPPR